MMLSGALACSLSEQAITVFNNALYQSRTSTNFYHSDDEDVQVMMTLIVSVLSKSYS